MKTILTIIWIAGIWCEDLITKEGAAQIVATGADWEVVDPDKSVFQGISKEEFAGRLQTEWPADNLLPELNSTEDEDNDSRLLQYSTVPANFDGRKEWGKCIHSGGDQVKCNGCWAFGVANHLSDRFCVMGWDVVLSVQDLLECATGNKCCQGGSAENAYKYVMKTGLVDEKCKPFDGKCNECRPKSCARYRCIQNSAWVTSDVNKAKKEIYERGPITAIYDVYADFAYYKGGIYYRTTDEKSGIHSVTLVGWGVRNGMEYWICKNSWGDDWGDKGYFMIKMGDSGINKYMTSCTPLIEE